MLNHFNFKVLNTNSFFVTNDFGFFLFLNKEEFRLFITNKVKENTSLYNKLREKLFLLEPMEILSSEVASELRRIKKYTFDSTVLHIFVVTTVCNYKCVYCQAQASCFDQSKVMTFDIAKKAIDIALQSPSNYLTFEFQGGEPLVNFKLIKQMVEYTESVKNGKHIEYTVVSNLSLLTDEIIKFMIKYKFSISTSLDGPKYVNDTNRIFDGGSSYTQVLRGLQKINENNYYVGAIQTTTRYSLPYAKEIVREYFDLGMKGIFLRPLTPLGFAKDKWKEIGYTPEEFLIFYRTAFWEIIEINKKGICFPEMHAKYFLKKILLGSSFNYMELRSPCGAGIGQLAYYYDGNVYTCDEARMVAESGDDIFWLGNVNNCRYDDLMSSKTCKITCSSSVIESLPSCCDCVYQPYCGVCPVVNYALEGDLYSKSVKNYRCKIYSGILDFLFGLIQDENEEIMKILYSWVGEKA